MIFGQKSKKPANFAGFSVLLDFYNSGLFEYSVQTSSIDFPND